MNNNIVTKEEKQKRAIAKYMMEQLEIEADCKDRQFEAMAKFMSERSEIDVSKCKGRD